MVGQNLFQISFEDEDDLEMIMEGRPWLFRKQLIIFDRLKEATKRRNIKLVFSQFWLKIGPCPSECEKKDLMHAIGSTFGGVMRSEIKNDICRLKVQLDVQKPLWRGIFITTGNQKKVWLPFKYVNLLNFCFGCGCMGYAMKDCTAISNLGEEKLEYDLPYSLPLKAESNLIGKESLQFGFSVKKSMKQCLYIRENERVETSGVNFQKDPTHSKMPIEIHHGEKSLQKSIWNTKRKFEIQMVGQNLFQISFEDEDDLEMIMEGRPWLFRKQLIIFDRLKEATKRRNIKLVFSQFWLKIGPCPSECEKKDLMHAIGSTFGGVMRSEIKNDICRLKVQLDVQKPLWRGIFITTGNQKKVWLPFKYVNLLNFCFGCGCMGYAMKDCTAISNLGEEKLEYDLPYSLPLKAESNLIGKESLQFGFSVKKSMKQCLYIRENERVETSGVNFQKDPTHSKMPIEIHHGEKSLQKVEFFTERQPVDLHHNSKEIRASNQCCSTKIESTKVVFHVSNLGIEQSREKAKNMNRMDEKCQKRLKTPKE
ncbi:hypothetical protein GOBAR_AA18948 [Gossypium barbadense]|uniref:CCHC-type domain-containing protein n=1 Tax=Gossypium barbadense TaxID=3634 RepID=A0A2P5XEG1_GOSBA|nr:hypothetical protein GOBAR_AA18948 [Gossypium barbadense]